MQHRAMWDSDVLVELHKRLEAVEAVEAASGVTGADNSLYCIYYELK